LQSRFCKLYWFSCHAPVFFFFQAEDGIRDFHVTGVQTCALPIFAEQGRAINASIERQAEAADRAQSFWQALQELEDPKLPKALDLYHADDLLPHSPLPPQGGGSPRAAGDAGQASPADRSLLTLRQRYNDAIQALTAENLRNLRDWPQRLKSITDEATEYQVRSKTIRVENYRQSLSHQPIPKIAAPTYKSWGE